MIKPLVMAGALALLAIAGMSAPYGIAVLAAGAHMSAHAPSHAPPVFHHRKSNRLFWSYGYYPYGSYGDADATPPPPPSEKPVAETRRECEPKSYSVPSSSGGESQVTIIRC